MKTVFPRPGTFPRLPASLLLLTSVLLLVSSIVCAQPDLPFYVTAYNGKVVDKRTGRTLTYGDIVYSRDTLLPVTTDYYIGLANKYGMYELTPSSPGQKENKKWSEFALAVYNSIFDKVEIKNLSTRGIDTHVVDVARFFHPGDTLSENRILLLSFEKVVVKSHSLDNGNYYYVTAAGVEDSETPIKSSGDTLVFSSAVLPHGDSSRLFGPYDLYYRYTVGAVVHRKRITDFSIVFISASEASRIADNFLAFYKKRGDANETELQSALESLFLRVYRATPRGLLLKDLLQKKVKQYLDHS